MKKLIAIVGWSIIIHFVSILILPFRLLYDVINWKRHKLYLDEGPLEAIKLAFNPIVEIFRHRGTTYMDSLGDVYTVVKHPGGWIELYNGLFYGNFIVDE